MENITHRIFRLAAERNVKQVDIATACKLNPTTVNSWKTRNITPPSDVIIPICRLLEVSPEFLLAGWTTHYPEDVALPPDEASLLQAFRACNDEGKMVVRASALMEARRASEGGK